MKDLKNILQPFISLTHEDLEILLGFIESAEIKKEGFFVKRGEICRHLALVQKGIMRVVQHVEGRDITANFFSEGEIFTSSPSFQLAVPSEGSFVALTNVQLALIHKDHLELLFQKGRKWERLGRLIAEPNVMRYSFGVTQRKFDKLLNLILGARDKNP